MRVIIHRVQKKVIHLFFRIFLSFRTNFMKLSANIRKHMPTDGNLILTKSNKYPFCSYDFFVKIITLAFSEEDKHLIQFYRKTGHLGARRTIKLFA